MVRPANDNLVWIPAVPLPLIGVFTDMCSCRKRFRSFSVAKRRLAYEVHWRLVHEPESDGGAMQGVTRAEARSIYALVEEARMA
jgi:hypothetical protein